MRKIAIFALTLTAMIGFSAAAMAADASTAAAALNTISSIASSAALAIGFGVSGPGLGQGLSVYATATGIARNPEAGGSLRVNMIIGLALIESLAIYALVVALLLIYAFPYREAIIGLLGG
ncbi:MAG: ATP synthase F0 subunit C [Deltaproteobacteria bacterium]|jgi:F-type H+-transporting ATPase subunit c|nr:ATP synthase F0 subunit C [Deltaproteobacteria bacterium]